MNGLEKNVAPSASKAVREWRQGAMVSGFETAIVASVHLVGLRWSLVSYRREEPVVTRVAILGCGSVARGHVSGWREVGADVVLAVDTDEPRARAFAHEVEIEETAGAWDAALDRKDITIVDICLPHALHAPAAIAAAQAGKHVFVEKPIATTLEEADRM